ncbi:MAG: helix-turn-helix transcriptional regulator [Thermomicrobiales bacterium]
MNTMTSTPPPSPIGQLIRTWRNRRHLTQMELALDAEISTRHLSFLETGRSQPSREMIERLATQLEIPLRERNSLHVAAGFAPIHPERTIDELATTETWRAIEAILAGHAPHPALAVDRHWNLVVANRPAQALFAALGLGAPPPAGNILRATFHPHGLARFIENLPEWRAHMLDRLTRQVARTADPELAALYEELLAYPSPEPDPEPAHDTDHYGGLAVTLQLRAPTGHLRFVYATTLIGSPRDVTLSEIGIESFFPADAETAAQIAVLAKEGPDVAPAI